MSKMLNRKCPVCHEGFSPGDPVVVVKDYVIKGNRLIEVNTSESWYHSGCYDGVLQMGLPETPIK